MDDMQYVELIEQLIEEDGLTAQSTALGGVLVRAYQQFRENRDAIAELGNSQAGLQEFEQQIAQLTQQRQTSEQDLEAVRQKLSALREKSKQELSDLSLKLEETNGAFLSLQAERQDLQSQLDECTNKPRTIEQLQHRLQKLKEEKEILHQKIDMFGTTAADDRKAIAQMNPLVAQLEALEAKMDKLMDSIWGHLKNDTFDAIFQRL